MLDREKLLIYPFDIQSSPLLRNKSLLKNYEITAIVSPSGWGFCGRDAGYVDGGDNIGISVGNNFNELLESVDTVLFMESFIKLDIQKLVLPKIQQAAQIGKNIICTLNLEKEFNESITQICYKNGKYLKYYNPLKQIVIDESTYLAINNLYSISVPVVFVLGVAERTHKFAIQLSLRDNLMNAGYKVAQVGSRHYCEMFGYHSFPSFMYSTSMPETKKIILFNNYIKKIEADENPDIIVIGIPGGLMQFNKQFSNNFGIFAYEISQAVSPDIAICSLLYEEYLKEYFDKISLSVRYKLGFNVDFFSLSNTKFDWVNSKFQNNSQYITVDSKFVDRKNIDFNAFNISVTNILNKSDASTLADNIIKKLASNDEVVPVI